MTHRFDDYRPPQQPRKPKTGGGGRKPHQARPDDYLVERGGAADGSKESMVVPKVEFTSYYGQPIVKAPPWEWPIAVYLFLGGVAGGSQLLAAGADITGRKKLRAATSISALGAAGIGSLALIADLGRPERMLNMFRVFKLSSPMSWGSYILMGFASAAAIPAAAEADNVTGRRLPLPQWVRKLMHSSARPARAVSVTLAAPLATYTGVLFGNTSNPAWNGARNHLPFLFASSGMAAAGGLAMVLTPVAEADPARVMATAGAVAEIATTQAMNKQISEVEMEPYHTGKAGKFMKAAEIAVVAGGVGAALLGGKRWGAIASGVALLAGSVLTRFGVLEAGLESTQDPKYVVEPQKAQLRQHMESGQTKGLSTTAG